MIRPLADSSEQQLLSALRTGDSGALRRIFDQHYSLLLGDVYRIIPDEDTCKDLVQEVFVELWRKHTEIDIHTSLRAYLRRSAINRALNYIKTSKRIRFEEPDQIANTADTSPRDIAQQEVQESLEKALHAAIETLPEKCRLVFSLSRFEQLSHREIAGRLDISVKTIENQITKAMKILREALLDHGYLSLTVISIAKYWWEA